MSARISDTAIIEEDCSVGDRSFIGHFVVMRPNTKIGIDTRVGHGTVFEGDCVVGDHCVVHAQCHITAGTIIEDWVFIAPMVTTTNDRHIVHGRRHIKPFIRRAPLIRRAARIGNNCCILPGVEIGENAIVGAGSVVTKDVAPRTIVMGNPARFVKNVPEEEII